MHRPALVLLLALPLVAACSKSEKAPEGPTTKVTKEAIERAKAKLHPPLPVADARAKLVEELGEPTAKDGENLIWAGVSGRECNSVTLVVQDGEAKGTMGVSVDKMMHDEFDKCAANAAGKP